MTELPLIGRRTLLGGSAAAMIPGALRASPYEDAGVRALSTYSESIMVMAASASPEMAFTLRFCRFPDAGVTWLWCHVLLGSQLFAFTHHALRASGERLNARTDQAAFSAEAPFKARLVRKGPATAVDAVAFQASLPAHASTDAPHGPGEVPVSFAGAFTPRSGLPASVGDRQELMGQVRCRLAVGGRDLEFEGQGKFHEQSQMRPRFVDPFSYLGFWGPSAGGMFLRALRTSAGGLVQQGAVRAVADYAPQPPGRVRRLTAELADGAQVDGELTALSRFSIPIFGERWRGSFVRGRVAGSEVAGMMNDWRPHRLAYA